MIKLFGEEELFAILLKSLTGEEATTSNRRVMPGHLWFPHPQRLSCPRTRPYSIISVTCSLVSLSPKTSFLPLPAGALPLHRPVKTNQHRAGNQLLGTVIN